MRATSDAQRRNGRNFVSRSFGIANKLKHRRALGRKLNLPTSKADLHKLCDQAVAEFAAQQRKG